MSPQDPVETGAPVAVTHAYGKLPAQNVERARAFYAEKLGLQPFAEVHSHLYYDIAGIHFVVFPSSGEPSGTHDQFGLVVADIETEVARLKARGVEFKSYPPPPGASQTDHITDLGAVRAAWFQDSEGNLLSIAQFPAGSPLSR